MSKKVVKELTPQQQAEEQALKERQRAQFGLLHKKKGGRVKGKCECPDGVEPEPVTFKRLPNIEGEYCQACMGVLHYKVVEGKESEAYTEEDIKNQTYIPCVGKYKVTDVVRGKTSQHMKLYMEIPDSNGAEFFHEQLSTPTKVAAAIDPANSSIKGKYATIEYRKLNSFGIPIDTKLIQITID